MSMMLEVKNGFLCRSGGSGGEKDDRTLLLLSSTERLLSILGYGPSLDVNDAPFRQPHGLPPLLVAGEEEEKKEKEEKGEEDEQEKQQQQQQQQRREGLTNGDGAFSSSATPLPFRKLKRINNSPDAVFRALDDIRDLKHRITTTTGSGQAKEEEKGKEEKEEDEEEEGANAAAAATAAATSTNGETAATASTTKGGDASKRSSEKGRGGGRVASNKPSRRNQALESQRERLRQIQSGQKPVSVGSGGGGLGDSVEEGWITVARVLNSLKVVTPILLSAFLNESKTDSSLEVGQDRVKLNNRKVPQAFFLGEAAFDVVQLRTLRRQHALLRDLLGFLGVEPGNVSLAPPEGGGLAVWSSKIDSYMTKVSQDSGCSSPSSGGGSSTAGTKPSWAGVLPFDDLTQEARANAMANAAKLDVQFKLLSTTTPSKEEKDGGGGDDDDDDDEQQQRKQYLKAIDNLRERLEALLKEKFPDARLSVYGSCLSDLSLGKDADVDLSLHLQAAAEARAQFEDGTLPVGKYQRTVSNLVYTAKVQLQKSPSKDFVDLEAVTRARVPVLKGKYKGGDCKNPHSEDGSIHFDICFLNDIAVVNSNLIREYSLVDPRARALLMAVKRWAKDNRVGSAQDNTLSSYTWMNMVVFYLQSVGLLPNLQSAELRKVAGCAPDMDDYWSSVNSLQTTYLKWEQVKDHWKAPESVKDLPVSALLYGFFQFYDSAFPSPFYLASIKRGCDVTLPKTVFAKRTLSIAIEDPFETYDSHCPHNLGIHGNEKGFRRIAGLVRSAAAYLRGSLLASPSPTTAGSGDDGAAIAAVERLWPEPTPLEDKASVVAGGGAAGRSRGDRGGREGGGGRQQQRSGRGRGGGGRKPLATDESEAAAKDGASGAPDPVASADEAPRRSGGRGPRGGGGRPGRGGGRRDIEKKDNDQAGGDGAARAVAATDVATTDDEDNKRGGGGARRRRGGGGGGGRSSRKAIDPPADGALMSDDEGAKANGNDGAGDRKPNRRRGGGRKPATDGGDEATSGDEAEGKSGGGRRGRQRGGGRGRGGGGRDRSGTDASGAGDEVGGDAPEGGRKKENGEGRNRGRVRPGGGRGRGGRRGQGSGEENKAEEQVGSSEPAAGKLAPVSSE
jgi:senataxin/terminal uridylyltransferase